jgi:hypothetical protein
MAEKYSFKVHIWADMFYKLANNGEYIAKNVHFSNEVVEKIPKGIGLCYWDYDTMDESVYDSMFTTLEEAGVDVWFGGAEMTEDLLPISEYILGSGTYGLAAQKAVNVSARTRGGRIGYLFARAFPPYWFMAEKYPSLRRVPILLPFYWIYRIVRAIFAGKGDAGREIRALQTADSSDAERLREVMRLSSLDGYR